MGQSKLSTGNRPHSCRKEKNEICVHAYFGIRAKVLENSFFCAANQISVELTAENAVLFVSKSLLARSHSVAIRSHTRSLEFRLVENILVPANFTHRWKRCNASHMRDMRHAHITAGKTEFWAPLEKLLAFAFYATLRCLHALNVWNSICSMKRVKTEITVCMRIPHISSSWAIGPCLHCQRHIHFQIGKTREEKKWSKKEQKLKWSSARCTHTVTHWALQHVQTRATARGTVDIFFVPRYLRCIKYHSCINADMHTCDLGLCERTRRVEK